MIPFQMARFDWGLRRYWLKEPVSCSVAFQDGLWVYECPRYRLHAFAYDRREALSNFKSEFALLYNGLVGQPDTALTLDARKLRDLLAGDIERVEQLGD